MRIKLNTKTQVNGYIFPGASLENVAEAATTNKELDSFNKNDWIVLIAGCNNLVRIENKKNYDDKVKSFISVLTNQSVNFKHTNLVIATIPYRYDLHNNDITNKVIKEINEKIRQLVYNNENTYLLDLYRIERRYHTTQGYHINSKGKKEVVRLITTLIFGRQNCPMSAQIQVLGPVDMDCQASPVAEYTQIKSKVPVYRELNCVKGSTAPKSSMDISLDTTSHLSNQHGSMLTAGCDDNELSESSLTHPESSPPCGPSDQLDNYVSFIEEDNITNHPVNRTSISNIEQINSTFNSIGLDMRSSNNSIACSHDSSLSLNSLEEVPKIQT